MRAFGVFIVGVLTGWILKTMMADPRFVSRVRPITEEITLIKERVQSAAPRTRASGAKTAARARAQPARSGRDDLKQMKGVGPAVEKKLRAAGLDTFSAIAALSAAELEERVGSSRSISAAGMIAQAKKLARRK